MEQPGIKQIHPAGGRAAELEQRQERAFFGHAGRPPKAGLVSSSGTPSFAAAAATAGVRCVLIACLSKLFSPTPPVGFQRRVAILRVRRGGLHGASWRSWTA